MYYGFIIQYFGLRKFTVLRLLKFVDTCIITMIFQQVFSMNKFPHELTSPMNLVLNKFWRNHRMY